MTFPTHNVQELERCLKLERCLSMIVDQDWRYLFRLLHLCVPSAEGYECLTCLSAITFVVIIKHKVRKKAKIHVNLPSSFQTCESCIVGAVFISVLNKGLKQK